MGHRQPCCERHRVLLVTPGTRVWPGDLVTANVQTKLEMDDGGGELVRTIQFTTKHTDHDMLSHCIHRVCTLVKMLSVDVGFMGIEKHEAWSDICNH